MSLGIRLVDPRNDDLATGPDVHMTVGAAVAMMLEDIADANRSPETVKFYNQRLTNVLSQWWEHDITTLEHQQFKHLRTWILRDFKPATANGYLRAVKRFLNWVEANGWARNLRARDLDMATVDEHVPPHLSDDQIRALLGTYDEHDLLQWRDRILTMLLLDTGLRISEAISLTIPDVDGYTLTINRAKSRKGRVVAMSPTMQSEMDLWIRTRRRMPDTGTHLFPSNRADRMSGSWYYHNLVKHGEEAELPIRVTPHVLRYTYAHNFLNSHGGDVAGLSRALGHSTLHMSMHYARMHDAKSHRQSQEASPLGRILGETGGHGLRGQGRTKGRR